MQAIEDQAMQVKHSSCTQFFLLLLGSTAGVNLSETSLNGYTHDYYRYSIQ